MEKCLEGSKYLIEHQVNSNKVFNFGQAFSEYQKVYSWTNENIAYYLGLTDYENKSSALSVMASGDHAFNLALNGINTIDTFDTNKLTEFFALGFKRAMILKYDYHTFLEKIRILYDSNTSITEISELILGLLPYMDKKYADYWRLLVDYNYRMQKAASTNLNLFLMISLANNIKDISIYNNYLIDEIHYNELRNKLGQTNISFKCANAIELAHCFDGTYDLLLLSNILDYFSNRWKMDWDYEHLQEYERELERMMNPGGIIFLKYIMNYGTVGGIIRNAPIGNSSIKISDLIDEEIVKVPLNPDSRKVFDGMILKRMPPK